MRGRERPGPCTFEEQARGEDAVLPALSALAVRIRQTPGRVARPAIQRANRPLQQVTTASLTALELYTEGQQLWVKGKYNEAVKTYESALQQDPEFAMAHAALGNAYVSHIYNQPSRGRECFARALELASRTTRPGAAPDPGGGGRSRRRRLRGDASLRRVSRDVPGRLARAVLARHSPHAEQAPCGGPRATPGGHQDHAGERERSRQHGDEP